MNDLMKYYSVQAGSGLPGFQGVKYQKGYGFFGRLLSGAIYPVLRFLGKNVLNMGANVAKDLVEKDDFSLDFLKNTAKENLKKQGKMMFDQVAQKMKGSGRRRKRRVRKNKSSRKIKRKSIKGRKLFRRRKVKRRIKNKSQSFDF